MPPHSPALTRRTARVRATALLLLLGAAMAACSSTGADQTNAVPSQPAPDQGAVVSTPIVDTVAADTALAHATDTARAASAFDVSGTLEPQSRALLRAELSGALRTLAAKVGEPVRAGAVLATLEVPAVRAALAAAEAQVQAQQVSLQQVQRERARVAGLLAVGGVSRAEMDEWDARVQATEAALQAAQAQRASAQGDVARLTVRAPFSGVVERRMATQGSMVQAGDELLSIIDPGTLELDAGVPATLARAARPGARVALRVAGWGDSTVTARIVRVAPALDPVTRQLRVTVRVPNAAGRLPAGAWAEGTLLGGSAATGGGR